MEGSDVVKVKHRIAIFAKNSPLWLLTDLAI